MAASGCGGNAPVDQPAGSSSSSTRANSNASPNTEAGSGSSGTGSMPMASKTNGQTIPANNFPPKVPTPTPVASNPVRQGPTPTPVTVTSGEIKKMVAQPPDNVNVRPPQKTNRVSPMKGTKNPDKKP